MKSSCLICFDSQEVAERIEIDLELLGITGIEDKLQVGVPVPEHIDLETMRESWRWWWKMMKYAWNMCIYIYVWIY